MSNVEQFASTSVEATRARTILEKKVAAGQASAMGLFERVMTQAPRDAIAKVEALRYHGREGALIVEGLGDDVQTLHRHALQQIAGRADVPGAYLSELAHGAPWQVEMAAEVLNRSFFHGHKGERALVRSVTGQVRGFLSDRYRRLDSRPLLETFAATCQEVGAVPIEGTVSDVRVAMKALLPTVFEPVPGEALCLGVEWGNSDFGAAKHSVRAFIYRLWCLNGATMEDALSQVHLGGRLSDDIAFSKRTYELDTKASISALKDVVKGTLGPAKVEALLNGIKAAHEKKVDWKGMKTKLAKKLLANEIKAIEAAYESEDVVMLPEGQNVWRVSNAISWIAGKTEDADRKLELQRLAGEVVNGKADAIAKAA
jgi:hypothetical protein